MKRTLLSLFSSVFLLVALCLVQMPAAHADNWYWLSSDSKYSKYFDPASVVKQLEVETSRGKVPTLLAAWTRTTYSYGGAQETLAAYGLSKQITNPALLSYSYALVHIDPQQRTLQYQEEAFYDAKGNRIWHSDTPGSSKEINSQSFDEAFYDAIVDQAFATEAEREHAKAKDRWLSLWEEPTVDGQRTSMMVDTSTLRMKGNNLIGWYWQETKDSNGNVIEIKFLKQAVNLQQGSEKVISGQYWSQQTGWEVLKDIDGIYRSIRRGTVRYDGLESLRSYVQGHEWWVNRYRIDN